MRSKTQMLAILIVYLAFLSFSCGHGREETPADTLVNIYMAANNGWYSAAEGYIYSEVLQGLKQNFGNLYIINLWDVFTRYGGIQSIEILNEKIRGERADISFKIHFKDGQVRGDHDIMLKEDRRWKILFDFQFDEDIQKEYREKLNQKNTKPEEK